MMPVTVECLKGNGAVAGNSSGGTILGFLCKVWAAEFIGIREIENNVYLSLPKVK